MKIILLMGGPRAGVDFFQSLLDGHHQILQFPGIIYINDILLEILSTKDKKNLAIKFVKEYSQFFDSRYTEVERHNKLGPRKNKHYKINKNLFIKRFVEFSKFKNKFKNSSFQNLYLLHKAYNSNISNKNEKILIINAHILPYVFNFGTYFKNIHYEIIHTMRNPFSAITSTMKNWLKYKNGFIFTPKELYYNLEIIFFGLDNLLKLKKKVSIIQLENLHTNSKNVLKKFCKIYKIRYSHSLERSTFNNLKWWGDKISGRDLNGVNKNFKISYDLKFFFLRDLNLFNKLFDKKFKKYSYKKIPDQKFYNHFFPLKCELLTWINTFKNKRYKHILSIPYYYLKRIVYFNLFLKKKTKLPFSIGLEKKMDFK